MFSLCSTITSKFLPKNLSQAEMSPSNYAVDYSRECNNFRFFPPTTSPCYQDHFELQSCPAARMQFLLVGLVSSFIYEIYAQNLCMSHNLSFGSFMKPLTRIGPRMDLFRTPLGPPFCLQNELLITVLWIPLSNYRKSENQGHGAMNIHLPCSS